MVSTSTHKVQHMVSISTHKVQHKVSTSTHKVQHMVSISTQGEHINTQSTTQQCTLQTGQLRFGPYTILAWTAQSVNCHIALKAMFYLLINCDASKSYNLTFKTAFLRSKLMLI